MAWLPGAGVPAPAAVLGDQEEAGAVGEEAVQRGARPAADHRDREAGTGHQPVAQRDDLRPRPCLVRRLGEWNQRAVEVSEDPERSRARERNQ